MGKELLPHVGFHSAEDIAQCLFPEFGILDPTSSWRVVRWVVGIVGATKLGEHGVLGGARKLIEPGVSPGHVFVGPSVQNMAKLIVPERLREADQPRCYFVNLQVGPAA